MTACLEARLSSSVAFIGDGRRNNTTANIGLETGGRGTLSNVEDFAL
jgi:hypothetical protein